MISARVVEVNTQKQKIKLEGHCDKTRREGDQLYNIILTKSVLFFETRQA
mgnify:CR=1 FL=1